MKKEISQTIEKIREQHGITGRCEICGEVNHDIVCIPCSAREAARFVFLRCFHEMIRIKDISVIEFPEDKKRIRINKIKGMLKEMINLWLINYKPDESQLFHQSYAIEMKRLEEDETYAIEAVHYDSEKKDFTDTNIDWLGDLRKLRILELCGGCAKYPCGKVRKSYSPMYEIIICDRSKNE